MKRRRNGGGGRGRERRGPRTARDIAKIAMAATTATTATATAATINITTADRITAARIVFDSHRRKHDRRARNNVIGRRILAAMACV